MKRKTLFFGLLVLVIGFVFIGCGTTGQVMVTGTARTPINPEEVKIYFAAPAEYETVGVITVQFGFLTGTQMGLFEEMQKQAAKIGANGVLVSGTGWIINGEAIFVIRE